jgi:hypothetical protein
MKDSGYDRVPKRTLARMAISDSATVQFSIVGALSGTTTFSGVSASFALTTVDKSDLL